VRERAEVGHVAEAAKAGAIEDLEAGVVGEECASG